MGMGHTSLNTPSKSRYQGKMVCESVAWRLVLPDVSGGEEPMSLVMMKQEREAFLADVHVGVISIPEPGRGPLTVPVWYAYDPGGELRVVTARTLRKGQLLARSGSFSLCAQAVV